MSTTKPAAKKAATKKSAAKAAAPKAASNGAKKPATTLPPTVLIGLPEGRHEWLDTKIVHSHPHNRTVDKKKCAGLASSMKGGRQIQAACVRPHPDKPGEYQLGAGNRRKCAAEINGEKLLCRIVDMTDAQIESMLAIENMQREAPDPREEAEQVRRLSELPNASIDEIAAALGKDEAWVKRRMKLTKLTDSLHKAWMDPKSPCHPLPVAAMEILASLDPAMQEKFRTQDKWRFPNTTSAVAEWVSRESCDLESAKFLDDPATFIPGCGPGCANSSQKSGLLDFAEFKSDDGCGSCLNKVCFEKRKALFRVVQWVKALEDVPKNFIAIGWRGEDLKLPDGRVVKFKNEYDFYNWKQCKKTDAGAVLFIVDNQQKGTVTKTYKMPPKGAKVKATDADGKTVRSAAETLKNSIERVQGKRHTELLERLCKHVKALPKDFHTKGLKLPVVTLTAFMGTNEKKPYAQGQGDWTEARKVTEPEALTNLWQSVQKVMLSRLSDQMCIRRKSDMIAPKFQAEMRNIAEITGFKFDEEYAAIARSMKLPATLKDYDIVTLKKKGKEAA